MPMAYVTKTFEMNGVRVFEQLKDRKHLVEVPANIHTFQLSRDKDSLRRRYEEKNEEFYRKRDDSAV